MVASVLFYLFALVVPAAAATTMTRPPTRVLVAGGGPCGLLTAHALLSRTDHSYEVDVVEAREDPRLTVPGPRAYSLGLNVRGQSALRYFDVPSRSTGLLSAVASRAVPSDTFYLHIGTTKIGIRKPDKRKKEAVTAAAVLAPPPPTLMVPRNLLCEGMLECLEARHGGPRLRVAFNTRVADVNLAAGEVTLAPAGEGGAGAAVGGERRRYDLIVGADGVQSVLRDALQTQQGAAQSPAAFKSEEVVLPSKYKIMVVPSPPALERDAIHAMEVGKKAGYGLFLIPAPGNMTCALVAYTAPADASADASSANEDALKVPAILREGASAEDIKASIAANYPLFGAPPDAAVAQLQSQRLSEARTVRCNRYHWLPPSPGAGAGAGAGVLLMGDAAHSTGGTLGQGANSALLDVVALDQCLDECGDDLSRALPLFSQRQTPEGLALWKLLQVPSKLPGALKPLYQLQQLFKSLAYSVVAALARALLVPLAALPVLGRLVPLRAVERLVQRNLMPTQNALSLTQQPFTDIVAANRFWVARAMAAAGASPIEFEA